MDTTLDTFETTEKLRELLKLSRFVSPRKLSKWVNRYVEWHAFAYWVRPALGMPGPLPNKVSREIERRCPGFLVEEAALRGHGEKANGRHFNALLCWIEEREFSRPRNEGWLPVVLYQARLHPRYQRVVDYWHRSQPLRSKHPRSPYPNFQRWKAAADTYTFEAGDP